MVDGAHEVVHVRRGRELLDRGGKGGADEVGLEADEEMDLGGIGFLETLGFEDVGFVAGEIRC